MTFIVSALLWVAVTGWVAIDADRRNRHWFGWAALVWSLNVVGLAIWLVARRRSPVLGDRPSIRRSIVVGAAASLPLLLFSIMLNVLVVTFLLQTARNLGHGMEPAIEDQERLVVNKLAYRVGHVQLGDVVMMYYPLDPSRAFVKRVIAQQGDTVHIVDGRVYVNEVLLKDGYVPPQFRSHDDWGPQVVPEGYFFVMGDHRNNSSDSRHWGYVPKMYILGKIVVRFGGSRGWGRVNRPF